MLLPLQPSCKCTSQGKAASWARRDETTLWVRAELFQHLPSPCFPHCHRSAQCLRLSLLLLHPHISPYIGSGPSFSRKCSWENNNRIANCRLLHMLSLTFRDATANPIEQMRKLRLRLVQRLAQLVIYRARI